MATVYLSPHSPPFVRGGHLHAFDRRRAQHQHEERLVRRARQRYISGQGCSGDAWRVGRVVDGAGAPCRR
eukprot:scaffold10961_cov56-Phaeocystis_antarctica.AAC.2